VKSTIKVQIYFSIKALGFELKAIYVCEHQLRAIKIRPGTVKVLVYMKMSRNMLKMRTQFILH